MLSIKLAAFFFQLEQLTTDLSGERSNFQKSESDRILLERQNKDLKTKLTELDALLKTRSKASIQSLEGQIRNLEEQLEVETRFGSVFS